MSAVYNSMGQGAHMPDLGLALTYSIRKDRIINNKNRKIS